MSRTEQFKYVLLTKVPDGNLKIALTAYGRENFDRIKEERDQHGINSAFMLLIQDALCNGWSEVHAEEIDALTSSLIISDSDRRDDRGKLISVERVYWNPNYAVQDEIENIERDGFIWYEGAAADSD